MSDLQSATSTIEVSVMAGELFDRGIWTEACNLIGFNPWVINEGRMDRSDRLTFTLEEARELGLLTEPDREQRR